MPPVRESSCTMSTRWQWRATASSASRSSGTRRAQIEHARLDAVGGQTLGDAQRDVDVGAVRDDREVVAGAAQRGAAERNRGGRRVGERLLDARIAIERDVLVVEHRIGIGDRRRHQRARVVRRRRHDDLQAGVR